MASSKHKPTKWTAAQRKFIEWWATPEDLRAIRHVGAYADSIGVVRGTLWDWRQLPGFNDEVQAYAKTQMGDALPEVLASLKEFARRGSFPHQKLYLEMLGIYTQRTVIDVHGMAERIANETGTPIGDIVAEADKLLQSVHAHEKGR